MQRDDLMRQRDDLMRQRDDLMRQRDDLMRQRDELIVRIAGGIAARSDDPVPSILFNTLPKSASVFILETLAATLGKPVVTLSAGYFPQDQIDFRQFRVLLDSRGIAQSHLDASKFNQRYISRIEKVIVQFRDPRQATLSWLHHLERLFQESQNDLLFTVTPALPEEYFAFDLERKIDYQLTHYLPQVIEWQADWVSFIDRREDPSRFMLSSYEAFIGDPARYFSSILAFLDCPDPHSIVVQQVVPSKEKNFRKGETDEWRSAFSESQADRATAAIPIEMQERFGWR